MTLSTFNKYLDYLDRSQINQVRLLGGEPTLHPDFGLFIKLAIQREKNILVFSNGFMPEQALEAICDVPTQSIKVLVNVTPTSENTHKKDRQIEVIKRLGSRAHLGYTIFNLDPDLLYPVMDIIKITRCCPSIRLGISQPNSLGNEYISPKHYRRIAKMTMGFIRAAHDENIQIELDCGFVRCMFTESEIIEMKQMKVNYGWRCNPIIDILIDESAIPCFPLSNDFSIKNALSFSERELTNQFESQMKHLRIIGVFAECSSCSLKITDGCSSGCLSAAIQRFHKKSFHYTLPEFQ